MNYTYIQSYQSLIYTLKRYHINEINIISSNLNIILFCKKSSINCYDIKQLENKSFKGLICYWKYLKNTSNNFKNDLISFHFHLFATTDLVLIRLLKKRNKIKFIDLDLFFKNKINIFNYFKLIKKLKWIIVNKFLFIFIFKTNFSIFHFGKQDYSLGFAPERLIKYNDRFIKDENEILFGRNSKNILKSYNFLEFDILYINNYNNTFFSQKIGNFFTSLKKKGHSIAIKPHPSFELSFDFSKFYIIERSFPVELFIFLRPETVIIGDYSVALNHFCENYTTISLINQIDEDENWKNEISSKFLESKVIKLECLDELMNYLK